MSFHYPTVLSMSALYGLDLFGDSAAPKASGPLAEKFIFPPFTVLDARSGEWLERKRAWLAIGLKSEVGRDAEAYTCNADTAKKYDYLPQIDSGTSIFDPVLVELACRWFCQPGGQVVDPFAGGSVRGIVAAQLGLNYWGCDLRAEQIEANRAQAETICGELKPHWVCGDSMDTLALAPAADFIFSCPPYGDLEVYSDDPNDLSNMEWHTFVAAYKRIILRAVGRLKDDRFACFVVGDFRDNKGFYRNFVSEAIGAFEACGARLYNEAILISPAGTAPIRATRYFDSGRKLVKLHQNVLVFCKGDPRKAAQACKGGDA